MAKTEQDTFVDKCLDDCLNSFRKVAKGLPHDLDDCALETVSKKFCTSVWQER